ncbi:MAG TPA: PP0621 family protein [Accumulibacter sp.]|nr:PP0621 family protein [Accumulibacter sp.]
MTKILLLCALLALVWWIWRQTQSPRTGQKDLPRPAEQMVRCVHCGVNQPISESILADGRYYCSVAHLHDARQDPG